MLGLPRCVSENIEIIMENFFRSNWIRKMGRDNSVYAYLLVVILIFSLIISKV